MRRDNDTHRSWYKRQGTPKTEPTEDTVRGGIARGDYVVTKQMEVGLVTGFAPKTTRIRYARETPTNRKLAHASYTYRDTTTVKHTSVLPLTTIDEQMEGLARSTDAGHRQLESVIYNDRSKLWQIATQLAEEAQAAGVDYNVMRTIHRKAWISAEEEAAYECEDYPDDMYSQG